MSSSILGCGLYLPEKIVSNDQLAQVVDTSSEWIRTRTGILQRHIAEENEYTSHLALKASKAAILDADILPTEIDLIVTCTTTPDNSFPSVATKLQGYLNLGNIPSFDIQAVCSGFIYGLHTANALMKSGSYNTILLVGAEKMSSLLDFRDRTTCVLFGDGASAVILRRSQDNSGIIDSKIYSDGSFYDILYTDGGVSMNCKSGTIKMKGQELFRHAVEKMTESVEEILNKNNLKVEDIKYFIPHQANERIIDAVASRVRLNLKQVVKTVSKHANCSAASVPLALTELKASNSIKKGDIILFTAVGAGLTWGSAILRW